MISRFQLLGVAAAAALLMGACGGGGHGGNPTADQLAASGNVAPPDTSTPGARPPANTAADDDSSQLTRSLVLTGVNDDTVDVAGAAHHAIRPLNTATLIGYDWVQKDEAGNIVRLGQFVAGSDTVTKDLHGDDYFTMGRCEQGLERDLSALGTDEDMRRYQNAPTDDTHFLIYQPAATFPAQASLTCDGGVFTAPTLNPGFDGTRVLALPSGSATLRFSDRGAEISAQIIVTRDSGSVVLDQSGYISKDWPEHMLTRDGIGTGNNSIELAIANGGDGAFLLTGAYTTPRENERDYHGLVTFHCK